MAKCFRCFTAVGFYLFFSQAENGHVCYSVGFSNTYCPSNLGCWVGYLYKAIFNLVICILHYFHTGKTSGIRYQQFFSPGSINDSVYHWRNSSFLSWFCFFHLVFPHVIFSLVWLEIYLTSNGLFRFVEALEFYIYTVGRQERRCRPITA